MWMVNSYLLKTHNHTCQKLIMAKSNRCSFYGSLRLACQEFSLNKLSAKSISFWSARFNVALFIRTLFWKKDLEENSRVQKEPGFSGKYAHTNKHFPRFLKAVAFSLFRTFLTLRTVVGFPKTKTSEHWILNNRF